MSCTECKNQLSRKDIFCNICGKQVAEISSHKKPRRNWLLIYNAILVCAYLLALLTCFIVDLAVNRSLTWFYIVAGSVGLAFSITNIPALVKRQKVITSGLCATIMVFVLLHTVNRYAGGDWFFSLGVPIATLSLIYAWIILLFVRSRLHWLFKLSAVFFVAGISVISFNPLIFYLQNEIDSIQYAIVLYLRNSHPYNFISLVGCITAAMSAFILGLARMQKIRNEGRPLPYDGL